MNLLIQWIGENSLLVILSIATLFGYFWLIQFTSRLKIKEIWAFLLSAAHTVVGVLCVKLFAFLESGEGGGMSLFGAVFFLPAAYYAAAKLSKRKISDVFDIFTICTIFTLLCARINCLIGGCCLGKVIPGTDGFRWPTRELEFVFYIVLLVWLGKKVGKGKYSGQIYPLYMISYGIFRFIVEWFRESEHIFGIFHISHLWALISIAVGAAIYYRLKKNPVSNGNQRKKNPKSGHKSGK